jgi:hypothetical protein
MSIARLQSFDSLIAIMVVCEMPVFRMDVHQMGTA